MLNQTHTVNDIVSEKLNLEIESNDYLVYKIKNFLFAQYKTTLLFEIKNKWINEWMNECQLKRTWYFLPNLKFTIPYELELKRKL